jgi:hypothetical protein
MRTLTLTPAYGRDYKSAGAAAAHFQAGKDFIVAGPFPLGGPYTNREDLVALGYKEVVLRFNRLRSVVIVKVTAEQPNEPRGTES